MTEKARIAHLAGPNATIQNTPALVTSNKARSKHNLPFLMNPDGSPARFDVLRPQRLAAPVTVYVEQFTTAPLAGFVVEGFTPYGRPVSNARHQLMRRAVYSGLPVVCVGRGNTEGFVHKHDRDFIGGSNLTATKARLLLMACLMKFGSLPPAADPADPTTAELAATREKVAVYQAVFDTH